MKNTNLNIRISPEVKRQITELAAAEGRSVSNLIERWITERHAAVTTPRKDTPK